MHCMTRDIFTVSLLKVNIYKSFSSHELVLMYDFFLRGSHPNTMLLADLGWHTSSGRAQTALSQTKVYLP